MFAKQITRTLAFSSVLAFAAASGSALANEDKQETLQSQPSSQVESSDSAQQTPAMGGGQAGGSVSEESESAQTTTTTVESEEETDTAVVEEEPAQESDQQSASIEPVQDEQQLIELQGKSVVNSQGEEIGQVDSIVRDKNDQSLKAVISSGGFLGMGGEKFAVDAKELQLQGEKQDQVQLGTDMSKEQIEQAASSYDEKSYEPVESETATGGGAAGGSAEQPAEEDSAAAPAPQPQTED